MRSLLGLLIVCSATGAFAAPLKGPQVQPVPLPAAPPRIAFSEVGGLTHGDVLTEDDPWYTDAPPSLLVGGYLVDLPPNLFGWEVRVQGLPATVSWNAVSARYEFGADVSLALGQPAWVPYVTWIDDPDRVTIGVVAELVDMNGLVLARDRMVIYDARWDPNMSPLTPAPTTLDGTAMELSARGLDRLEAVHASSLFSPDGDAFHADVGAVIDAVPSLVVGTQPDTCFRVSEAPGVELSGPYLQAYGEAVVLYGLHQELKTNGPAACASASNPIAIAACSAIVALGAAGICVQHLPAPSGFAVCVGNMSLDLTDVAVERVASVDLELATSSSPDHGVLLANPTLGGIDGAITVELLDLEIRWLPKPAPCIVSPAVQLYSGDGGDEELAAWATCDDVALRADQAVPAGDFTFDLAATAEELSVAAAATPGFTVPAPRARLGTHTCSHPAIAGQVADAVELMADPVAVVLSAAWSLDSPDTDQALALEDLLAPFETGAVPTDAFDPEVTQAVPDTDPLAGLWLAGDTEAAPIGVEVVEPATFFTYPAHPFTVHAAGTDPAGVPFDVSWSITTAHLNQLLRAGFSDERFHGGRLTPTWRDLGIGGHIANAPAVLDGTSLGGLHPVFAEIGAEVVTLTLDGTLAPFALMERDWPAQPTGDLRVTLDLPQLEVVLGNRDKTWARFVVDFWEPDLRPRWPADRPGFALVSPTAVITWTPVEWAFTSCPATPLVTPVSSCERQATAALANVLHRRIRRLVESLLADLPAPKVFDVEGRAMTPRRTEPTQTGWWTHGQVITAFGNLR